MMTWWLVLTSILSCCAVAVAASRGSEASTAVELVV